MGIQLLTLLKKYRRAINPPYSYQDFIPIFITVFTLLLLPFTILAVQQRNVLKSRADIGGFLALINQYRANNGLPALVEDQKLVNAACWMANDMVTYNYYSHTDSQGRSMGDRLTAFGITNEWKGENLAAGISTAQEAFNVWKNSPGHNANMLSRNFTRIGVGHAYKKDTAYGWYWVTTFASTLTEGATAVTSQCNDYAAIMGYKVKMPGNQSIDPPSSQAVTLDGRTTISTNPYFFSNLTPGSHTVSIAPIDGWQVGYTLCYNRTDCHNNTPISGNSVNLDIPRGGYADLYWHFTPPQSTIAGSPAMCHPSLNSNSCSVSVSWNATGYNNPYVCLDIGSDGSEESLFGSGTTGTKNQSIELGKIYRFVLRSNSTAVCGQGTMLAATLSQAIRGDVNCDSIVNSIDALNILRYISSLTEPSTTCQSGKLFLSQAKVDLDDDIDSVDALYVLRYVAGLPPVSQTAFGAYPLNAVALDSDGDLISDSKEAQYSCMNKFVKDATIDSDRDGVDNSSVKVNMDNASEIIRGSNPCKADSDDDGFKDGVEVYVGTDLVKPCGTFGWPADLSSSGISYNKIDIADITSFSAPIYRLNTIRGQANYSNRYDLNADGAINVADIGVITTLFPPMLNYQKALNGPACPFP